MHYPFNEVGEKEIPGSIKAWTASHTFGESDYLPIFRISETPKNGFASY